MPKKEIKLLESGSWIRRRRDPEAMFDSSDEENWMLSPPPYGPAAQGRTHPGGNSKGICTQRSVSPPVTGQPATSQTTTGHSPSGQETITDRSLATCQMGIIQEFSSQSITGHRPSSHQSLDRKYQHRGKSIFTGHWSPVYPPPVIRLFINLHLVRLMPWAWNSLIITQKRVSLPLEPDFSNMSDPNVVIEPSDNKWR